MKNIILIVCCITGLNAFAQTNFILYPEQPIRLEANGVAKIWEVDPVHLKHIYVFNDVFHKNKYYYLCDDASSQLYVLPPDANINKNDVCDGKLRRCRAVTAKSGILSSIFSFSDFTCNIDRYDSTNYQVFYTDPSPRAMGIVSRICKSQSIQNNFLLRNAPVDNACAVYDSSRYILYNEDYMKKMVKRSRSRWTFYFIMAHEIAHHLNGNNFETRDQAKRIQDELAADEWAGRALGNLGAPKSKALAWVNNYKNNGEDKFHPNQSMRRKRILKGWKDGFNDTYKYRLTAGLTRAWNGGVDSFGKYATDASKYLSLDVLYHPLIKSQNGTNNNGIANRILSHLAIGISYNLDYDVKFDSRDTYFHDTTWKFNRPDRSYSSKRYDLLDIKKLMLNARFYFPDYFKSNLHFSLGYSIGAEMQQGKLAMEMMFVHKMIGIEGFIAPTGFNFENNGYQTWKMLYGLTAHFSFMNYNHAPR